MCECVDKCNCDGSDKINVIIGQKGEKGDNGATPTIVTGTATTGAPGTQVLIDFESLGNNTYQYNFTIPSGTSGTNGTNGFNGWSPILAVVTDGQRRVLQIVDWTGGSGSKPSTTNQFLGSIGIVSTAAAAVDVRGSAGASATGGVPIGCTIEYGGVGDLNPDPDTGAIYFVEDGRAISRATYPTLFSRISIIYGSGDGVTTFNIPNSKGRVVFGLNSASTFFTPIGFKSGITNGLASILASNLPIIPPWAIIDPGHNHTISNANGGFSAAIGIDEKLAPGGIVITATNVNTTGISMGNNAGAGQPLDVKSPYIVKTKLIRVL